MEKNNNLKKKIIGIAVFGYNRPKELETILLKIQDYKSKSSFNFEVKVFIDGLKKKEDKKILRKNLLIKKKFNNFKFIISDFNKGLSKSILNGLDRMAKEYEYFLVFEDDILIIKNLDILLIKVIKKKLMKKYSSLSFYCPFGINFRNFFKDLKLLETYRMQCWGWFTSSENWKSFRKVSSDKFLKKINKKSYILNIGEDSYSRLLETIYNNRDIWACRWIAFNYKLKKPSLVPSTTFIKNIGTGNNGTNVTSSLSKIRELLNEYTTYIKLIFFKFTKIEIKKIKKQELEIITNRNKII